MREVRDRPELPSGVRPILASHVMLRSEDREAAAATLSAVAGNPVFLPELPGEAASQSDQGIGHG